jgi:hypothetical protein
MATLLLILIVVAAGAIAYAVWTHTSNNQSIPDVTGATPMPTREELLQQAWSDLEKARRQPTRGWQDHYLFRAFVKLQLAQAIGGE